jgi:tetratricopeptide (TPR) repeat protein
MLAACASVPPPAPNLSALFKDALFTAPSERISAQDVFALSPEMQAYAKQDIARLVRTKGSQQGLFDALYDKELLRLEYDAAMTRNASQAFAARAGNCLSLVIMTAAFAKDLGMPVRYQNVFVDETWSRNGDYYLSIGHVNLSIGRRMVEHEPNERTMTIDFLPPRDTRSLRSWVIDESMIVAMYMNNRAVESMTSGDVNEAYWWAREAIVQEPRFLSGFNTLGVVYQQHGNLAEAQQTLEYVLDREPANTRAISNLASVMNARGQVVAARELTKKLEQMEPNPPFGYFKRGLAAMEQGNYKLAKDMFAKEVDRAAYYHEFHFWLALAYVGLGETDRARTHMAIAAENSTSGRERELYGAKLERLRAYAPVIRR